jgi:hypothetical protein
MTVDIWATMVANDTMKSLPEMYQGNDELLATLADAIVHAANRNWQYVRDGRVGP